jgi:hypothetical protein
MREYMTSKDAYLKEIPELREYLDGADVNDTKTIETDLTLREFLAGCFSYMPRWLVALFWVRGIVAKMLRLSHDGNLETPQLRPEDVPMTPGESAYIFTTHIAKEEQYWVAHDTDSHLDFNLIIAKESIENSSCFYVSTLVFYNNRVGRFYYALITPFHHLIVRQMMKSAVKKGKAWKEQ